MRSVDDLLDLLDRLRAVVGDRHVLTDADQRAGYEVDWTGRFRGSTPAVVRPATTEEVAAVVATCDRTGAAVVPQGGNTGLVGGSVPRSGEIVLSLRRLDDVGPVDGLAAQMTVGAGATLGAVQAAADAAGLAVGVDLAARDSATVGGMVATNAGGLRHLRYGDMRAQLAGVEAVLADGSVVSHLEGLAKDNTGYDLPGLVCGSEGTLAVVTAVRLRLVAPVPERVTALLALVDVPAAMAAVATLRRTGAPVSAAELMLLAGMTLVAEHRGSSPPVGGGAAWLLVDWDGDVDGAAAALAGLDGLLDVAVADDPGRRAELWAWREAHTEAINRLGPPHKLDVTLPLAALADFAADVVDVVAAVAPGGHLVLFGHAADGNLHVNVVGPAPDDDRVDDAVLRLVAERGGSISAEHGIGTAKKRWLHLNRSPAELRAFAAIKNALDPHGTLNPNVLLP